MEIIVFISMMIVPIISVIALVLAVRARQQINALKKLTVKIIRNDGVTTSDSLSYMLDSM